MLLCTFFCQKPIFVIQESRGCQTQLSSNLIYTHKISSVWKCKHQMLWMCECVSVWESIYIVTVLYVIPSCGLLDCRGCSSRRGQRGYEHFLLTTLMQHQTLVLYILARTPFLHHPLLTTTKKDKVCVELFSILLHTTMRHKRCHRSGCLYFHIHIYVFNVFHVNPVILFKHIVTL